MKVGDNVRYKQGGMRVNGKVIRVHDVTKVGVIWSLEEGAILCQAEYIENLELIEMTTDNEKG